MQTSDKKVAYFKRLNILLAVVGILSMLTIIILIGFRLNDLTVEYLRYSIMLLSIIFVSQEIFRWYLYPEAKNLKDRWLENLLALLLLLNILYPVSLLSFLVSIFTGFTQNEVTIIDLTIIQIPIILVVIIRSLRSQIVLSNMRFHPGMIFTISFALVILIGTMLLLLPRATPEGHSISFVDAIFTSTSAVCVTGLIVLYTAKDFTLFGQVILLLLIQIGALGIMTITTFFSMIISGGLSFKVKIMMREMLSEENISTVRGLLLKILMFTFSVEFIGQVKNLIRYRISLITKVVLVTKLLLIV